jgi:hypothetical protein
MPTDGSVAELVASSPGRAPLVLLRGGHFVNAPKIVTDDFPAYDAPRIGDSARNGSVRQGPIDSRHDHLQRLSAALEATGDYAVRLMEYRTKPPELHIRRLGPARLTEDVGAECDRDGAWWLTWSWGERICRADDTSTALASIGRVLTIRD